MRGVIAGLVMLAACGDSIDAAPDAAVDASTPAQLVRVRVALPDASAGVRVFFQDPESALLLATRTNDAGRANAFMPRGGYVTVATPDGDLWTWSGVEPGDELVLGETLVAEEPAMQLSIPADPDAASYWLHAPCTGSFHEVTGAQSLPRLVTLPGCTSRTDLLIITREVGFERIAHYRAALDVELGTVDAPTPITIPGPYETARPTRVAVTNAPQGLGFLYVHQELIGRHGVLFDTSTFGQATIDTLGSRETTLLMPAPQGTSVATYLDDTGSFGGRNRLHLVTWGPPSFDVTVDLARLVMPAVSSLPALDPGEVQVIWSESGAPLVPEAVLMGIRLDSGSMWRVLAPRGPQSAIRLPVVPISGFSSQIAEAQVTELVMFQSTTGYSGYREHLLGWTVSSRWPIAGTSGVVAYSEYVIAE